MCICFYIIIGILLSIIMVLILKLIFIKLSIRDIRLSIHNILGTDTNNLLSISSKDKDIRELARVLNIELVKLREQKIQYENGNQELKSSITNVSHDMRTPLTAISGYLDLLKEEKNKTKQSQYMQIIERKTDSLIELTEELFTFSKAIDLGEKMQKDMYCINEILEEALANYYLLFKESNITPKIQITKINIYKNVDRNTILRVFDNILSNSIKYSNGNFKVILDDDGKITFSNKANSLDVTTVEKIFNRYFTVENAKKSVGIGLSIAKQLVELNDGSINASYIKGYLVIEITL